MIAVMESVEMYHQFQRVSILSINIYCYRDINSNSKENDCLLS
jgi:hypothetical protein